MIALELPDPLAEALERAAKESGSNARELTLHALRDFLAHSQFALQERHQLEDISASLLEAGLTQ